jgi:hypothetical protein
VSASAIQTKLQNVRGLEKAPKEVFGGKRRAKGGAAKRKRNIRDKRICIQNKTKTCKRQRKRERPQEEVGERAFQREREREREREQREGHALPQ